MTDPRAFLEARLKEHDPYARLEAAAQLAQLGSDRGNDTLRAGLTHKDQMVRSRAAFLMGQIGAAWTIPPLAERLRDPSSTVRNEVIFALMRSYRPAVVPHLIEALEDEDPERVEDARVALVTLLGDGIGRVLAEMEEEVAGEAGLAHAWWRANAHRFDEGTCYERGMPVSIGRWIEELATADPSLVDVYLDRLTNWTGEDFGAEPGPALIARWRGWWKQNVARFPPGRRYHWGHEAR